MTLKYIFELFAKHLKCIIPSYSPSIELSNTVEFKVNFMHIDVKHVIKLLFGC